MESPGLSESRFLLRRWCFESNEDTNFPAKREPDKRFFLI
jgi:hypothetical protein